GAGRFFVLRLSAAGFEGTRSCLSAPIRNSLTKPLCTTSSSHFESSEVKLDGGALLHRAEAPASTGQKLSEDIEMQKVEIALGSNTLSIECGKVAKQADGSA